MKQKMSRRDLQSREARDLKRAIIAKTFVTEGTFVALPTCFPGASVPIASEESRITALCFAADGTLYGATSGGRCHLFAAWFHADTGAVFDLGILQSASQCPAICCSEIGIVALANPERGGGRAILCPLAEPQQDFIQEWHFNRSPFEDLGECVRGEPILHAVSNLSTGVVIGLTSRHLFALHPSTRKIRLLQEMVGTGKIALTPKGNVVGASESGHLWMYDPATGTTELEFLPLPKGQWSKEVVCWSRAGLGGLLYVADGEGRLFSFDEARGLLKQVGRTPVTPVRPLALTSDGRLFGFCGDGIAHMFSYNPVRHEVKHLGAAVSVIERRRYGYVFNDAATGRDGQVVFGENDNGGHLWLYFPSIEANI